MNIKALYVFFIVLFLNTNLLSKDLTIQEFNEIKKELKSNKIVIAIEPTNAVSVTDLTPDAMTQNYPALTEKLNISIRNF